MKKAIIYARVSTARQADDGVSMESQIEQCRVKATQLGAEVVEVFRDDGVSGRTDNRPGFQAALAYCAAYRVSHFICWSTSRFGRNLEDALKNASQLREWGTKASYVHQDIDLETDQGWMVGVMTGMMDEIYSRNVSRDTLRSMMTASRDGFWVGGHAPFGYRAEKIGKRSRLVIDEEAAPIVRKMFDLARCHGLGAQAVAHELNTLGLKRDGRPWGKNTVNAMLHNTSYKGERVFNRTHNKTREAKGADQVVHVASHPAIILKEHFDEVQTMMQGRIPHASGGTPRSSFAFSGLMVCGVCGNPLQIRNGTARNGTLHSYYACLAHKKGQPRCCLRAVPAEKFDHWMVMELLEKVLTVKVVEQVVTEVRANGGQWAKDRELQRKELVKTMREAEGRRNTLYEQLETTGKGKLDLEDITPRLRALNEAIRNTQDALEVLENTPAPDYDLVDVDPHQAVATIREVIMKCEDKKKLRGLLGTFVQQVALSNVSVTVEYREDALLRNPTPTVHSGVRWLLDLGSNQGPTD